MPPAFLQTSPNVAAQRFESLSPLAHFFSLLGREEFFLLLLPILYLGLNRQLGARLGALLLGSESLNVCLKVLVALPRPYWIDPSVRALATDASFGMPSSHAQNAAAVWPFLARGHAWNWRIAAAILVAGIALSRVFLGVHFVADVVAGVIIGTVVLLAFVRVAPRVEAWFEKQDATAQVLFALAVAGGIVALFALSQVLGPDRAGEAWAKSADFEAGARAIAGRAGAMFGLIVGAGMCARRGLFGARGASGERAARVLAGLVGVAVLYAVLGKLLPSGADLVGSAARFGRYAAMAWWITDGTPRLFERRAVSVGG